MTYNVFSVTLNPTQSLSQSVSQCRLSHIRLSVTTATLCGSPVKVTGVVSVVRTRHICVIYTIFLWHKCTNRFRQFLAEMLLRNQTKDALFFFLIYLLLLHHVAKSGSDENCIFRSNAVLLLCQTSNSRRLFL